MTVVTLMGKRAQGLFARCGVVDISFSPALYMRGDATMVLPVAVLSW